MTTEEEERIEAGLDLTGEERREARGTVPRAQGMGPAMQRRSYAKAYEEVRRRKLVDNLREVEEENAEREAEQQRRANGGAIYGDDALPDDDDDAAEKRATSGDGPKEFPPALVKPAPDRPVLTVTRRGRHLRLACGGLVAFIDPLEVASVNSYIRPSRIGYTDVHEPLTTISIRGGLCIQVPQYTADEVFAALDDAPRLR